MWELVVNKLFCNGIEYIFKREEGKTCMNNYKN